MKKRYSISFYGLGNKIEEVEIEASSVAILSGVEHDIVCWDLGKRTVFAIPLRLFIQTKAIPAAKAVQSCKPTLLVVGRA